MTRPVHAWDNWNAQDSAGTQPNGGHSGVVLSPGPGIDGRDALATSMFSSPGVYAFLVGSGMSTAAGVPTGERIIDELILRVAKARGAGPEQVDGRPRTWWYETTGTEARYDVLLEQLARTDAARQSLLRGYLECSIDTGQPVEPTAAHRALADLCRRGFVRVVLTTNFDALIERALDEAGVGTQVLSTAAAVKARIPLVHSAVTVVKLHGDYRNVGLRNTPIELRKYALPQRALLREVLSDYGLVTVGWSAEWDPALVAAIEGSMTRRYPMYWATYRDNLTQTARRLIANRRATPVTTNGADDFLPDLAERIDRSEQRRRRRRATTIRRNHFFLPPDDSIPTGWGATPLLTLRVAAHTSRVTPDEPALIGPEEREGIVHALRGAAFYEQLAAWNSLPGEPAVSARTEPDDDARRSRGAMRGDALAGWTAVPNAQSGDRAQYRLGGDATLGVSALAEVRLPRLGQGDAVLFILDIGVSVTARLPLAAVAAVLRDGLVTVTSAMPDTVSSILPRQVDITLCSVHLVAATMDGHGQSRDNDLDRRIDLDPLDPGPSDTAPHIGRSIGFTADIPGPLTTLDAARVIVDGMYQGSLAAGFLDPRGGISTLRQALGVLQTP